MKKFLFISAIALSATACMNNNDVTSMPPGKYERTEKSTDAYGTTTERKTSTEVDQDAYGNKRAIIDTKTTKDPEGFLNKTTTDETKQVIEQKNY